MSQVPMIAPLGCSRMKVHRFEREKNTLEISWKNLKKRWKKLKKSWKKLKTCWKKVEKNWQKKLTGHVSSSRWSNVSKVTSLWVHSVVLWRLWLLVWSEGPSKGQGHLLSCCGQLKIIQPKRKNFSLYEHHILRFIGTGSKHDQEKDPGCFWATPVALILYLPH